MASQTTCCDCGRVLEDGGGVDPVARPACPDCGSTRRNVTVCPAPVVLKVSVGTANVDTRYGFTAQFLCASAIFARRSREIEATNPDTIDDPTRTEHRGYVTAAVMQSVAALEAETWEITTYGPGHHLGSNGIDREALAFLRPLADVIDREGALDRYAMILHLLRKPPVNRGVQPWQDADLLVKLRNELTHYKSKWGQEMERQKLYKSLKQLRLPKPPFIQGNMNFFPHECLSAGCAAWAVKTAVAFVAKAYESLGVSSPLAPYSDQFVGL